MNELQVFSNDMFGEIRTVTDNDKVMFCGSDVATALGYKRARDAVRMHCPHAVKYAIGVQTGVKSDGSVIMQEVETAFIISAVKPRSFSFEDVTPKL